MCKDKIYVSNACSEAILSNLTSSQTTYKGVCGPNDQEEAYETG
jgi:hypothetical protein